MLLPLREDTDDGCSVLSDHQCRRTYMPERCAVQPYHSNARRDVQDRTESADKHRRQQHHRKYDVGDGEAVHSVHDGRVPLAVWWVGVRVLAVCVQMLAVRGCVRVRVGAGGWARRMCVRV